MKRHYKTGDWLYVCQRCGNTEYASRVQQEWNGSRVCPRCFENRQPQDFVSGVVDDQAVPFANPPGTPQFLAINEVQSDDL